MTQLDEHGHLLPVVPPTPDPAPQKPASTIRRSMVAVASVAILLGVVRPIYLISDAKFDGPYTRAFQERCLRMTLDSHLVGRPEEDILAVLGPPTSVFEFQDFLSPGPTRVYRYSPSWTHAGSFQVLCGGGIVGEVREEPDHPD